jgi:hypothetical protein
MSSVADLPLLIEILNRIDTDEYIEVDQGVYVMKHPLVNAAIYLADCCLTNEDKMSQMAELAKAGYHTFPGEQDRFGWLTGCIQLSRGVIVFG